MKYVECRVVDIQKRYTIENKWLGKKNVTEEELQTYFHEETGQWKVIGEFYTDGQRKISTQELEKYFTKIENIENAVEDSIKTISSSTVDDRTTLVKCELKSGFVLFESSSCLDKRKYSEKIGKELCVHKIKSQIGIMMGFLQKLAGGKNV